MREHISYEQFMLLLSKKNLSTIEHYNPLTTGLQTRVHCINIHACFSLTADTRPARKRHCLELLSRAISACCCACNQVEKEPPVR